MTLRALPMCGMCGGNSTRLVQTLKGSFLLCDKCEPPEGAGPVVVRDPMPAASKRFALPPLPPRKKLPPLPPRKRVVVAPSKPQIVCLIDYTYAENEREFQQECVVAECTACGHQEQSWGHGDKSVRRCLVLMGENCPGGGGNFYILERAE